MRARRTHPVLCLVALAAYLLNLAAAAGGAVLCHDPAGESSVEFACDHDHCSTTVDAGHEHHPAGCWCSSCPCEDSPLVMEAPPWHKDDDLRASAPDSATLGFAQHLETKTRTANRVLLAGRPPPASNRSLRQLRTVVLIV
jgi:hypothetical protein